MQSFFRFITAFLLCVLLPCASFAAGFAIYEAGAKALGMGGAFAAQASDPSAVFFNPSGVADLEGTQVYLGTSLIFTGTDFAGVAPDPGYGVLEETGTLVFPPVNVYISHQLRDDLGVAFGLYNPYGLGQTWENPETFSGRHLSYDVYLESFYFNPVAAWRPHERIAVGAGLELVYASVNLKQKSQRWDPNGSGFVDVGDVELDGSSGIDVGFNAGVKINVAEGLDFGFTYRGAVESSVDGDATFKQLSTGNPAFDAAVAAQFPQDQGVATTVNLPWSMSIATSYSGVERWMFEIDVNVFGWSKFKELGFEFDDPTLNVVRPQNYEDKVSVRTGMQYSVRDDLDLRVGYYFDPTPQPKESMSPLLGDSDRHGFSLGFGHERGSFVIDAFALFLFPEERSTDGTSNDGYNGTYSSFGNLFGANIGYKF